MTAVLPAFNEGVSIGSVVLLTRHYVDEVIVVDDGSSDSTAKIAEMAGARVIIHPQNRGKGAALRTGFDAAKNSRVIVTLDTDGQHDPKQIPILVAPILSNQADMVNGSRYLHGKETDTPSYRRVGQTVLDQATKLNSGIDITDTQCGFRAFSGHTYDVFRFKAANLAIESEMLADASNAGLRITEVDIDVRYDVDCSTEHPLKHGIGVLVRILRDMEFNKPLYYFTIPGMAMGVTGLYFGIKFMYSFSMGGNLPFGPTILMVMLMIIGTFMSFTGIILHSIARSIHMIAQRPSFARPNPEHVGVVGDAGEGEVEVVAVKKSSEVMVAADVEL
ncbi:glycosyltransferase family 2 protein [Methanococcoides orientis]|uniref:glycosyltransferase family 2 protein n=1 Tax=Methanococcoides orientis TaxID=2822137 RepID=UPI002174D9C0|nr:glycosyltransferase family 2 protein [Methanococcoides orientis]UGV41942.1 glycosyltransferase family 2 protein [Methanococcoides orientis]